MTIFYADLSHYSYDRHGGVPDFAALKASGISAVCIRATYGDPVIFAPTTQHFREMAQAAKAVGLFVGGYHNLVHGDDASIARQVDWFKSELDAVQADWAMLDVEPYDALVANGLWPRLDDAARFEAAWTKADPQRVLALYVAKWFWQRPASQAGLDAAPLTLLQGPLVSSNYPATGETSPVAMYATIGGDAGPGWTSYGGKTPEIWQFSSRAVLPGVSSTEDINAYKGDLAQFKARLRREAPVTNLDVPDFNKYGATPYGNTTDAQYWLWRSFDAFEPSVQLGGFYADKPGFHNRGDALPSTDYSVRDGVNHTGPYWATKAAAIDLTFPSAQSGDYSMIAKYSKRLYDSARNDADPRLGLVMFDFYGQIDADRVVEGWNEYRETSASSDISHLWHIHISLLRSKVHDFWAMFALLTVLMGWSVDRWKAAVVAGGGLVPTPPKPAPLPTYTLGSRVLKVGTRGTDVQALQKLLTGQGYATTADGVFGAVTEGNVVKWQANHWLGVDGQVGPDTLASIRTGLGRRTLKNTSPDMTGNDVKELQRRLRITADGVFGSGTAKAVVAFQGRYGLAKDGEVGPITGRRLWSAT